MIVENNLSQDKNADLAEKGLLVSALLVSSSTLRDGNYLHFKETVPFEIAEDSCGVMNMQSLKENLPKYLEQKYSKDIISIDALQAEIDIPVPVSGLFVDPDFFRQLSKDHLDETIVIRMPMEIVSDYHHEVLLKHDDGAYASGDDIRTSAWLQGSSDWYKNRPTTEDTKDLLVWTMLQKRYETFGQREGAEVNKTYLDFDLDKALGDKSAILKKINQCFKAAEKESKDYKEFSINHGYFRQHDNGDWSCGVSYTNDRLHVHKELELQYTESGIKAYAELTEWDADGRHIVKYDLNLDQKKYNLPQIEFKDEGEAEGFINPVLDRFYQGVRDLPYNMRFNTIFEQILADKICSEYEGILNEREDNKLFL